MRKFLFNIVTISFLVTLFSISYAVQAQVRAYRVSDRQVRVLINRIDNRTNSFRRVLNRSLNSSALNGTGSENSISAYVSDFETATKTLRDNFNNRIDTTADVQDVLNRAGVIQNFLRDYPLNPGVQQQWGYLRTDLSALASYYNIRWNWNGANSPAYSGSPVYSGRQTNRLSLTGTYRLNTSLSDNVTNIVDRSLGNGGYDNNASNGNNQDDRVRRNLERRLTAPDVLVIDKRYNQVTLASSLSPQVTFHADGVTRTETNPNGRVVKIRATSPRDGLEVSYQGDRINDFFLTLTPLNNGQLRVTRRLYLENRNQTVTAVSVYDKTNQTPDFSVAANGNYNNGGNNYPGGNNNYPNNNYPGNNNNFIIPNATPIVAVLNNQISTQSASEGDRFTMTVRSPSQYAGATIEGYLSNTQKSGRITGRAQVTFNFETIRFPNGNTYRFAGIVDQVRQPNGDTVSVNNEGVVRDNSQTTKTVTRAGIGAALGAIIGAIAGGGSGAAIGAGVGAGAGAGSVVLQGRDNLDIQSGAEFRITSSAPGNISR
ncbi:MAG: hypothetical protein ACR2LT_02820 [Pyrinomonadaceae bacterium]